MWVRANAEAGGLLHLPARAFFTSFTPLLPAVARRPESHLMHLLARVFFPRHFTLFLMF